ncbi:MAG: YebC/PmpR family DNA-binding transcriptional regulator [Candidatus Liptonbacteria bacterium]|nr:YebC/PmpR family DNA-binding transcriptional regulator [Candidatus Liptonbacteria bacterium]
MSGHSHWAGIKHKKGATDQKRAQVFSKLLAAISAAAKTEMNPDFNPRLRTAIEKAREANVPAENIKKAVKRASETDVAFEELIFEAYGPGSAALLIEATSDSKNRTVQEIKNILAEAGGKWAESGSVRWAFNPPPHGGTEWKAKFPQEISAEDRTKLQELIAALEEQDDVQRVYSSASE